MSNGLLKFLASPAGQRFGAGMKGLSAGLLQAGAPRVGAPGPNAWGAGFQGMSAGIEAERQRKIAEQQRAMQEQLMQMKVAEAKAVQADRLAKEQAHNAILMGGREGAPANVTPQDRMNAALFKAAPEQYVAGQFTKPAQNPVAQRNAAFLYPGDPERQRQYVEQVTTMSKAPVVNVGADDSTMGGVPAGHKLIADPSEPSGFRVVPYGGTETQLERDALKKQNQDNYAAFAKSLKDLGSAMGATTTGPGLGWLPAITSGQQLVESSRRILSPQLKDLFRKAGEGVFTNADQLVLEGLIPDRNTSPDVAKKNIQMIDYLVRIKLGIPIDPGSGAAGAAPPEGFTVIK